MKFSESHEWVSIEETIGTVGVSDHAQKELGDIVYVELPSAEKILSKGAEAAVLESTKAAADVYSPVSGKVIAVNERLKEEPGLVNTSPQSEGWLFKVQLTSPSEADQLLGEDAYAKLLRGE